MLARPWFLPSSQADKLLVFQLLDARENELFLYVHATSSFFKIVILTLCFLSFRA